MKPSESNGAHWLSVSFWTYSTMSQIKRLRTSVWETEKINCSKKWKASYRVRFEVFLSCLCQEFIRTGQQLFFILLKKYEGQKSSLSLWLQGQFHTRIHRSIKYVWCYVSVGSGAVVLYSWRHKPVKSDCWECQMYCPGMQTNQPMPPSQEATSVIFSAAFAVFALDRLMFSHCKYQGPTLKFLLLIKMLLYITMFIFLKSSHIGCKKILRYWPKTDAMSTLFFYPLNVLMVCVF